jgi:hypothetical protein
MATDRWQNEQQFPDSKDTAAIEKGIIPSRTYCMGKLGEDAPLLRSASDP